MKEFAGLLHLSVVLRHPTAAPATEALLQGQAHTDVAIPLPDFSNNVFRRRPVRKEKKPFSVSARLEGIVDVEADRRSRSRTILNESSAVGTAIEIRIELVCAIESETLVVVDVESI